MTMERRPASRRVPGALLLGLALLWLAAAGGCQSALFTAMYIFKGVGKDADFDGLEKKKVVVVCRQSAGMDFSDPNVARDIDKLVTLRLTKNVNKIDLVDPAKVQTWEDENPWDEFVTVGRAMKAEMVVGIELDQFSIREGQTVYQGKASATVKVVECKTGKEVFSKPIDRLIYPPNHVKSVTDVPEAQFRREFEEVLAERLARFFYRYDPHDDIGLDAAALR
jgi:hypothetical protein